MCFWNIHLLFPVSLIWSNPGRVINYRCDAVAPVQCAAPIDATFVMVP